MTDNEKELKFSDFKLRTYLIGSMEAPADKDGGVGWRKRITPKLKERNIYTFDPTREEIEKVGMPTEELHEKLTSWQLSGNWKLFCDYMRRIWRGKSQLIKHEETKATRLIHILGDVDYVERSNFLIWNFKEGDKPGGTIAELVIAWYRGIPVYLITKIPKHKLNKSLLYFVLDSGHQDGRIFTNQNQLLQYIDKKYLNKE